MTKGDKIKLRAELAGKAMQGMLSRSAITDFSHLKHRADFATITYVDAIAIDAVTAADSLMAQLDLSLDTDG